MDETEQKWMIAIIQDIAVMMMHDTDNFNICNNLNYNVIQDDMDFMEAFRFQKGYNFEK